MDEELKKIPKPESKDFKLESINSVNHKPHPYCITPKHLLPDTTYLNEATIKEAERQGAHCGMFTRGNQYRNGYEDGFQPCHIPYDQHTTDKVLFIKALVDKPVDKLDGLQDYLKSIVDVMKELKIDGVAFIEPDKPKKKKKKRYAKDDTSEAERLTCP
jgi:hypothetical protein